MCGGVTAMPCLDCLAIGGVVLGMSRVSEGLRVGSEGHGKNNPFCRCRVVRWCWFSLVPVGYFIGNILRKVSHPGGGGGGNSGYQYVIS